MAGTNDQFDEVKESVLQVLGYLLTGSKILIAFAVVLYQTVALSFVYFLVDILSAFYKHHQEDKDRDLSNDNFEKLKSTSSRLQQNFDKLAKSQQKYEQDRELKDSSLKLLNKLIAEGLIRGKDLLQLSGSSGYYQLFVYSASLNRLAKPLGLSEKRQYPIFLESLGFARMGKASTLFIINKDRLENKRLQQIKNMKQFLSYHFSRIRKQEWSDFLGEVKKKDISTFRKLNQRTYIQWGHLKYNYLLTETNMNPTNIGFVDGEYLGLGVVATNSSIMSQILEKAATGKINVNEQLKVKIRAIIEKLDITLLLEGIEKQYKDLIDLKQDIIKQNMSVENVIEFHKSNKDDLTKVLVDLGVEEKKSQEIAEQIISTTNVYKKALEELNIQL